MIVKENLCRVKLVSVKEEMVAALESDKCKAEQRTGH